MIYILIINFILAKISLELQEYIYKHQLNKIEDLLSYCKAKNSIYKSVIKLSSGEIERYIKTEEKKHKQQLNRINVILNQFKQQIQSINQLSDKKLIMLYNKLKLFKFKIKKLKINILYVNILINNLNYKVNTIKITRITQDKMINNNILYLKNDNYDIIQNFENDLNNMLILFE